MKKLLFIDRDGTIIHEAEDEMLNEIHKFRLLPGVVKALSTVAGKLDYTLVLITNQDGLGTDTFPEKDFWPLQEMLVDNLAAEGIQFDEIIIDTHYAHENSPYRKPGIGRVKKYMKDDYDLAHSFVIGDRWSDIELAKNMGAQGILIQSDYSDEPIHHEDLKQHLALNTKSWSEILHYLVNLDRESTVHRTTNETKISIHLNLDGSGTSSIDTGLNFFDHMLTQIAKHGEIDLNLKVEGDLEVDEHHTIEDTAIVLGQVFKDALGKKAGIQRYGFLLPMDDALAQVALDFGGRGWLEWDASFTREYIGDLPTEMIYHFFKSFSEQASCNLNIKCEGDNEHHKVESIFKAFAKAIKMAKSKDVNKMQIPSTKGTL